MAIVVQLIGGLGNQMFQYAAGRSLAHRLDLPLKLDLSKFEEYKLRNYKLNHLSIEEYYATPDDLESFSIPEKGWERLWYRVQNFVLPWHSKKVIKQRKWSYDEGFHLIRNSCLLKGYWQSEKYFKNIEEIIRNEFQVKEEIDGTNKNYLEKINNSNSVSIHIRRGDYVTNPGTNKVHGFLGEEYYKKAIQYFESEIEAPEFFVFSDDIEWARENLRANNSIVFVDHNGEEKDYEDLRLMMNCKYHIIANSSFSWWGAWLGKYPEKKVIAPNQWYSEREMKRRENVEIVPDRWIRL